ncbi:hypothetical protein F2P81_024541 [Scophthalmus maximus]|uniref:Uncharacterized protein n=1 Tax=Scophthalmus maximus TaxID=52904 RepID=A0A6A4RXX0_SCOMX|nr:hypothetical protein F2P81_024541 [Scophthalmus maximus]
MTYDEARRGEGERRCLHVPRKKLFRRCHDFLRINNPSIRRKLRNILNYLKPDYDYDFFFRGAENGEMKKSEEEEKKTKDKTESDESVYRQRRDLTRVTSTFRSARFLIPKLSNSPDDGRVKKVNRRGQEKGTSHLCVYALSSHGLMTSMRDESMPSRAISESRQNRETRCSSTPLHHHSPTSSSLPPPRSSSTGSPL